ncbi:unnamed protein product [Medioppia subpectinata]|uniref:Uncharacterized protein n=1 Tax=Medioppia subpectinata TaxID=1979941 RepID=A0A7R9Q7N3_9ACAR|nr:unnamed protein product [Medioppia subpectinata]CAG2114988.1 unnamed protein product [Medioppia subpectinata]
MRIYKLLIILSVTIVVAKSSPNFGDRIHKNDNNSSLIEVFRPSHTQPKGTAVAANTAPDSSRQSDRKTPVKDNNSNNKIQRIANERHVDYKFSTFQHKDNNINKSGHEIGGNPLLAPPVVDHRSGVTSGGVAPRHHPPTPQEIQEQLRRHFPQMPDFGSLHFGFDVPHGSSSDRVNDPRAGYKQEVVGAQNNAGKPFGKKTSYTYRDPKDPNNYMEVSEVSMTMNREMDPQEAQSQVQHFIAMARSGQYGPFHAIPVRHVDHSDGDDRHPNHNYESEAAEPSEPNEPNFPKF